MATLFFEGFDKGIVFNKLDPNYWSSQYKLFPKYSFGGYLPYVTNAGSNAWDSIGSTYVYNSPNGGILPYGQHTNGYSRFNGYNSDGYPGTQYPEFGTPPGFLAFSNIDINNPTNVEFPTYLQASGFPLPSGDTTYFSMRCLGLESKHRDLSPYPHRHTFFSYNSGNIPQLTVNVVQVTGNSNLISLNNEYSTLALEIQQNDQTIGYFDLNISQTLTRYRIASVYNSSNTILTIADTISSPAYASIRSRWSHLEFAIDQSTNPATLSINLEDINLPVINNDIDVSRESWETSLPISGFNFNNLRFYNRTYSSAISVGQDLSYYNQQGNPPRYAAYYMFGQNLLLDDMALIDNVGEPSYFLGSTARVISMIPGKGSLLDNDGITDGVLDWSTNSSAIYRDNRGNIGATSPSHRKALLSLDNDDNAIEAINSGVIDAVSFTPFNHDVLTYYIDSDLLSRWRNTFNDAVGGIKLYNSARKKYLDTKFVNVFVSGVNDPYENSVSLLLHGDSFPIVDSTRIAKAIANNSTEVRGDNVKFGEGRLLFNNSSSYLSVNHSDLGNNLFTIESWIYFNNHNQIVSLFNRIPTSFESYPQNCITQYYGFSASTIGVTFTRGNNCDKTLLFPGVAQTGVWHHLAIVRTPSNALRCFLNGVGNTTYMISDCDNRSCYYERDSDPSFQRESQGIFQGTYSINFLNNTNITASNEVPNLKIGLPKKINLTDEYFNNVSLLVRSNESSIIDISSNPKQIINNGVVFSNVRSRFGHKSLYFTGGKTLSFGNSNDFNFGSDDFTIEFWYYINNIPSTPFNIFSSNHLDITLNPWMSVVAKNNGIGYAFRSGNSNNGFPGGRDSVTIDADVWYHVSIVKNAGDLFFYIVPNNATYGVYFAWPIYLLNNQTVLNPFTGQYNAVYNNFPMDFNNFTIGNANSSLNFNMYIDNLRVTKGLARIPTRLNASVSAAREPFGISLSDPNTNNSVSIDDYRITYGVCRYNENFTPPSEPFKAQRDNYLNIGPDYNVNKTVYQTYQHYMLKNPATNQPWKLPEVSGITLGVKKL
jgi:hypothetical protein